MTINDIKKEALELMFTNYSEDLRGAGFTDLDLVSDEQYKQYIVNMNGCINRCIKRFESANVLPLGRVEITMPETACKWFKTALTGVRNVVRVIYESDNEYITEVPFEMEGNSIVLPYKKEGKYIVLHNRVATILSANATYDTDLSNSPYLIPDSLCVLIPYYIKAELFEEDEPKLALQSRNTFEALLEEYAKSSISNIRQVRVESIFEE